MGSEWQQDAWGRAAALRSERQVQAEVGHGACRAVAPKRGWLTERTCRTERSIAPGSQGVCGDEGAQAEQGGAARTEPDGSDQTLP